MNGDGAGRPRAQSLFNWVTPKYNGRAVVNVDAAATVWAASVSSQVEP
jgi:hypothetical protein